MKKKTLNSTLMELVHENNSLSSYLDSLSKGREATPHSWLYEHQEATSTLQEWIHLMEPANNKSPFGEKFNQFDLKQVEKFGPQGKVPPIQSREVLEVIKPLYSPTRYDDKSELSQYFPQAAEFAKVLFGKRLMTNRPLGFTTVVDDMSTRDTLNTNSGFPRFIKRTTVVEQEIQDAISGKAYDYPAIILFRHYNGKLRPVWMFPMSQNLNEFKFSQKIQALLINSPTGWVRSYLSPWKGFEYVKETLSSQWPKEGPIVGGDTTKMDANMRPAQIQLVYEILKWAFQKSYWEELHQNLMHICEIEMLISTSQTYTGIHGLASGSGWTQLTETVLQMFMAWNAGVIGQGIGDDFYWLSDMSDKEIVDYLGKYGLPANPTKQSVSTSTLTFLQRLNLQGFFSRESKQVLGAYYPTVRALNSLIWPEKFHKAKDWNSDMFCIRNYMILENCVDDPCFEEFVTFVCKGQRDMINFAKQRGDVIQHKFIQSRSLPGLTPSYNQEKREKPLSEFASIKFAATL